MNEQYSYVREQLRQQHAMNTQEIHGKKVDNFNKYGYYSYDKAEVDKKDKSSSAYSLFGKVFLFLSCVILFSCYIYGGQDIELGAKMAWTEMSAQITQLEKEEPAVKQAMSYVRTAYKKTKDFTETYFNIGKSE